MTKVIEVHNDDKEFKFTCPVCGTIFSERSRKIRSSTYKYAAGNLGTKTIVKNVVKCPNCMCESEYDSLVEYNPNK